MQREPGRDVVLRMLDACFAVGTAAPQRPGLEPFQADAHQRLRDIIDRRGGAMLADSVGLGKTYVAGAIIRDELDAGGSVLVAVPSQLRAHWKRHLHGLPRCRLVSHAALSRGTVRAAPASLVVADEAHAFRNPLARRYAALALLCEHSRVLLLTATPVNNSLLDFYHLIRLFAARDLFADIGVPDLLAAVESALRGSAAELRRIADAVMVRRSRRAALAWQVSTETALRFPQCGAIETLRYDLREAWPELIDDVQAMIPVLSFPSHGLDGNTAARDLMRLGLLKRLESSPWALLASVRRHIRLLDHFVTAAGDGLLFDPRTDPAQSMDIDGAVQLSLNPVALRPWPPSLDRARLIAAAELDLRALRRLCSRFPRTAGDASRDPKLARLSTLLDDELRDAAVLLFTEYQETARGLWRALAHRPGIALVHGSDARLGRGRSSRRVVIERFAPLSNHARIPRTVERVRILIATDVLAEGLNLQDAHAMISYDLPWNPVRLAQRIGRIDRLGSPHSHIRALAFVPDRGIEELLGLMKRIRRKLRHIRVVGGDAPWSLVRGKRHTRVIDDIDAAADARERVRAMWREASAAGRTTALVRGRTPAVGIMTWRNDCDAALCCFRIGRETLLVLTADSRPAQVGTAACWSVLADALAARTPTDSMPPIGDERLEAAASAAGRLARNALRSRRRSTPPPDRSAALAGAAVLRWLAHRPGGPSRAEMERADAILRQLSAGRRAGGDIRIERLARAATSPDFDLDSLPGPARTSRSDDTRSGGARPDHDAELVAVLLLRPVTDEPARTASPADPGR